jgi:hypothetical protein
MMAAAMAASLGLLDREGAAVAMYVLVDLVLLALMTRSYLVVGATLGATAIAIAADQVLALGGGSLKEWHLTLIVVMWHALVGGSMLWWAVGARLRYHMPGLCKSCGYDLRGLSADQCPECGATFAGPAPTPSPVVGGVHSPP